jgi:hypothetical protein
MRLYCANRIIYCYVHFDVFYKEQIQITKYCFDDQLARNAEGWETSVNGRIMPDGTMWTGFTCFMIGSTGSGAHINTLMHLLVSYKAGNILSI